MTKNEEIARINEIKVLVKMAGEKLADLLIANGGATEKILYNKRMRRSAKRLIKTETALHNLIRTLK